jgi:hypothetical protein
VPALNSDLAPCFGSKKTRTLGNRIDIVAAFHKIQARRVQSDNYLSDLLNLLIVESLFVIRMNKKIHELSLGNSAENS